MGLSLGMIGGGGSILTVPILIYFFGQTPLVATTDSLFIVGTTALIGALTNARQGLINYRVGITFAVPSFAGVFFSRRILLPRVPEAVNLFDNIVITKGFLVLLSFAVLMVFASQAMIRSGKRLQTPSPDDQGHGVGSIAMKGFLVGCTTGFVGAGGGFLIIPALVVLLRLPIRIAIGTSLAIIAANSLFGFAISPSHQATNWILLTSVTALGIVGLLFGHGIAARFAENRIKQGFGYFVLAVGIFIVIDQVRALL